MANKKKIPVYFYAEEIVYEEFKKLCELLGTTTSAKMREIMQMYLASNKNIFDNKQYK